MSAQALDAAPAADRPEVSVPGGGGPGDIGFDGGGNRGDGSGDDGRRKASVARLGILLGAVSIFCLFLALSVVFFARSRTPLFWTPVAVPKTLWLSTALLLASSAWLEAARRALSSRNATVYRQRVLAAALLGLAFLACQGATMFELYRQGMYAQWNPHASLFYLFTGIHGAHLLGGLIALNWLVLHGGRAWAREGAVCANVALYWHFLDLVWLGLFGALLTL